MFLFLLCSLSSWLCPIPAPPIVQPVVVEVATEDGGPFWGKGQPWAGVSQWDTGHCPDYDMPEGGGRPSLSWPVPGGVVNENRPFAIGHTGIDIEAPAGSTVTAPVSGRVIWAGHSTYGFGSLIVISTGGWYVMLAHLESVAVSCGDLVGAGSIVGTVGSTGQATFSHLHVELRRGAYSYRPY